MLNVILAYEVAVFFVFRATVVQNLRTIYPGVYSAQLRPVGGKFAFCRYSKTLLLFYKEKKHDTN